FRAGGMDIISTFFNVGVLVRYFPLLLEGLWRTVLLGATSIALGLAGGLVLALIRLYSAKPMQVAAIAYIDVFRPLPVLVWLVAVYYALPFVGIRFSPFWAACVALSTVSAAYAAEIFRAGIEAVPRGQFEAADALGLHVFSRMRHVILPQAIRIVIPPLT